MLQNNVIQTDIFMSQSGGVKTIFESERFLSEQIITYIGNKRSLLGFIGNAIEIVKSRTGKDKLSMVDLFSGSGIVARYMKRHAKHIIANDIEDYCYTTNRCYLSNSYDRDEQLLLHYFNIINSKLLLGLKDGFISELYAPKDDKAILEGERVFYTTRNAKYIDTCRQAISILPNEIQHFFLAPLLSEASIKSNTSGVFKGFYKNSKTSIGQFGGNNEDALSRIKTDIEIKFPVFSNFDCSFEVFREDANSLAKNIEMVDMIYIDPPYNQHPYGSNYFMLNLINNYKKPDEISRISGIPVDWNRSAYNKKGAAVTALTNLINNLNARFILISYNSEGFITINEMLNILSQVGYVEIMETQYNTFRGSRNLRNRNTYTKEYLFLVSKERKER